MAITSHQFIPSRTMTVPDLRSHAAQSRQSSCIDLNCLSKRISNFCLTGDIKCLKLPATVSGNTIIIEQVSYNSFLVFQTVVEQRKLDCVRNWRIEYRSSPIRGRIKPHAWGTLRIKMPSARHEILKQLASRLMNDMWLDDTFVPKDLRGGQNIIADGGSLDLRLDAPGGQKCILQPDACLVLSGVDSPFLVLEVADSETARHAVAKAKRYIRNSGGEICFAIVLSVKTRRPTIAPSFPNFPYTSKDAHSDQTDLPKSPGNTDGQPVENTVGVNSDTEENNPSQSPLSRTTSSLTSLSSLSESQTVGGSPHIVPHQIPNSEIVSSVTAWVFKRGRKLVSGSNNKQSFKLAAVPVLEDIEIYPNRENRPTNFQIDWAEISDYEHETPGASFKVDFKSIASMAEHGIANDQKSLGRKRSTLSPESETTMASSTGSDGLSSSVSSEDVSQCSEFIINRSG